MQRTSNINARSTGADTNYSPSVSNQTFATTFKSSMKNDESIFHGASICKSFFEKREEVKLRESKLVRAHTGIEISQLGPVTSS